MWFDSMFAELETKKDEAQGVKMSAYMKDNFKFLGVPKPALNEFMKSFIKSAAKNKSVDWDFIDACFEKDYREAQYIGLEYIYLVQKRLTNDDIPKIKNLILTKSWWDTADCLDKVIGIISLKYQSVNDDMLEWSKSDNIWLRRVSIDYQQKLKEKTDSELLEKIIVNNLGSSEFFINKAIGWSLRDFSKINPEWVKDFIKRHETELSKLSIKEASKYL